ncbi:uncharacterized protein [Dendropsophus ebraccatus]|uniref:uncharacterized protein n=1 Tax=Dendropsophus ebraccatus TaxID=150705 RepID=UPI0038319444
MLLGLLTTYCLAGLTGCLTLPSGVLFPPHHLFPALLSYTDRQAHRGGGGRGGRTRCRLQEGDGSRRRQGATKIHTTPPRTDLPTPPPLRIPAPLTPLPARTPSPQRTPPAPTSRAPASSLSSNVHTTPPRTDLPTPPPLRIPAPLTPLPARTPSPQRTPPAPTSRAPASNLSSNAPTLGDCPERFPPEPMQARPLSASVIETLDQLAEKTDQPSKRAYGAMHTLRDLQLGLSNLKGQIDKLRQRR